MWARLTRPPLCLIATRPAAHITPTYLLKCVNMATMQLQLKAMDDCRIGFWPISVMMCDRPQLKSSITTTRRRSRHRSNSSRRSSTGGGEGRQCTGFQSWVGGWGG